MASQQERKKIVMTSEEAWKELRDLERDGKKKFTEPQKRAMEYAMVLMASKHMSDIADRNALRDKARKVPSG